MHLWAFCYTACLLLLPRCATGLLHDSRAPGERETHSGTLKLYAYASLSSNLNTFLIQNTGYLHALPSPATPPPPHSIDRSTLSPSSSRPSSLVRLTALDPQVGGLTVNVARAQNLKSVTTVSTQDPYVKAKLLIDGYQVWWGSWGSQLRRHAVRLQWRRQFLKQVVTQNEGSECITCTMA